ncbi:hypothetical protein D3C76_1666880 [compost metagenome]
MEAHQSRVVAPVAAAQQVPAAGFIAHFAVECQQASQRVVTVAFPVRTVDGSSQVSLSAFTDNALIGVGQQQ